MFVGVCYGYLFFLILLFVFFDCFLFYRLFIECLFNL